MSTTFYDHDKKVLSTFDPVRKIWLDSPVKYLDSNVPPSHSPRFANLEFQRIFTALAFDALERVNKVAKNGFVLDEFRSLDNLPGARLVDGNFVLYVVRKDKAGSKEGEIRLSVAEYRYEMRAFDSIKLYENQGPAALIQRFVKDMLELDEKA